MPIGLHAAGFTPDTIQNILATTGARQRALIDESINNSDDSVLGRINAIVAERHRSVWEAAAGLHAAHDPDAATGQSLANLSTITGTTIKGLIKSRVHATVQLQAGTTLVAGNAAHVDGRPQDRYEVPAGVTVTNGGVSTADFLVWLEASDAGPGPRANSGTLTVIATPVSGWLSVTNASDSEPGADVESSEALRLRREIELASGASNPDAVRSDILKVSGVTAAIVLENSRLYFDSVTKLPPKTIECVVRNGEDQAIRDAIWASKATGCETVGNVSGTITDASGRAQPVKFSRPVDLNIYVEITLKKGDSYPGDAAVKAAIADWGNALGLAKSVIRAQVLCAAVDIPGVADVPNVRLGLSGGTFSTNNITVSARQEAKFDTALVTLIQVP